VWVAALTLLLATVSPLSADGQGAWDGEAVALGGIEIQVDEAFADGLDWPALAGALVDLHLRRNGLLTVSKLDQTREALSAFGRVESTVRVTDRRAEVTLALHPYPRIKSIAVQGNAPLFDQDVLNAMQVAVGDFFRQELMAEQQELIARRFRAEGYVDPHVKIGWHADDDSHYRLQVAVDKGPAYTLSQMGFSGNRAISDAELKSRITAFRLPALWGAQARFKPAQVKENTRKLIEVYRRQGYADVDVQTETTLDPARARARVAFKIDEGPRYKIAFSGNRLFADAELEKELRLAEIGNRGNRGLRRGVQAIRRRYLTAGYADAQVRWQGRKAEAKEGLRQVAIRIDEGRLHQIEALTFSGNRHFDAETLTRQMLTRPAVDGGRGVYVAEVLEEDLEAVRALYQRDGFWATQVEKTVRVDPATAAVSVELTLQEGAQTQVGRVGLAGTIPPGVEDLMGKVAVQPGEPYAPSQIEKDENRLSAAIAPLGYPHARVQGAVTFSTDQTRADVTYDIDPGPQVQVGRIFFAGQVRTREPFLRREIGLTPGEPFNLEKILASQRDVRDLGVFKSVQVRSIGLKEKDATVPLLVSLRENKPYFFELGGGYQSDKGLYGRGKLGDRNLFGTAKSGWLSGEISEVGWLAEAGLSEPRLLGSRFSADAGVFVQHETPFNQQFGTDTAGATLTISRSWHKHLTTALGLRFEQREQFLRDGELDAAIDPAVLDPRAIIVTTPSVRWDDRDSFIRPRSGRVANLSVDISKGLDNALDDFFKYQFDGRLFYAPAERLVLAGRLGVGYLQPYGAGGQIPQDQLLFLGGTNSVRGFGENQLRQDYSQTAVGGRLTLLGSLEARYDLGRNFEASLFLDTGSVRQAVVEEGDDDFRWAAGVGLGYLTPIGPIGLFYGHKLDRRENESAGQFHLTIGYSF
jgi:outer membrane protein insertion porin family